MNAARSLFEADGEGTVHVRLPTGKPGRRVMVLVVRESSPGSAVSSGEDGSGVIGLLKDVTLEWPPRDESAKRDERE